MDDNNLSVTILSKLKELNKHDKKNKQSVGSFYRGTTSLDNLLKRQDLRLKFNNNKPFAFIINTIHSRDNGIGHWIAIVVHPLQHCRKVIVRYFDSLAGNYKIYKTIATYINNIKFACGMRNYIFALDVSKKPIQYYDSQLCGGYAAYFTIMAYANCNTLSIKHIFRNYKKDKVANDDRITRFLEYNYPAKSCHDTPVYGNTKATLKQLWSGLTETKKLPPFCPKTTLSLKRCFKNMKCKCHSTGGDNNNNNKKKKKCCT